MHTLQINNLSKQFGTHKVLNNISFSVNKGSVFGFIGQNGAGKTTTMKIILGLCKADKGDVFVCDDKVKYGQTKTNRNVGYLSDVPAFYGYMKPLEYLNLCGDISGISKPLINKKVNELLALVGLENQNKKISSFSRGMKQRLGIAQALLNSPKLLICDEPTSALDPIGRKEILDIFENIKGQTTVIFSTHILSDVERICDTVALLHDGKIALTGSLSEIKQKSVQDTIHIDFMTNNELKLFLSLYKELNFIESHTGIDITTNDLLKTQKDIFSLCTLNNLYPAKFEIKEPTLENLFLEVAQ